MLTARASTTQCKDIGTWIYIANVETAGTICPTDTRLCVVEPISASNEMKSNEKPTKMKEFKTDFVYCKDSTTVICFTQSNQLYILPFTLHRI